MHRFAEHLFLFVSHLGIFGLLLLGVLDSSFLFTPFGNDLLLIGLTSEHPAMLPYYVLVASAGSTIGCLLLDMVMRTGGEEALEKMVSAKRLDYLKRKMGEKAGIALAVASIAPPPFPFTPVVAAASAFEYPRWKLLTVVFGSRLVRFSIIGLLAVWLGHKILEIAKSAPFEWGVVGFIALCAVGSGISIYGWIRRSRGR